MIEVNLLPEELRPQSLTERIALGLKSIDKTTRVAVLGTVVILGLITSFAVRISSLVKQLEESNQSATIQKRSRQALIGEMEASEQKLKTLKTEIEEVKKALEQSNEKSVKLAEALKKLVEKLQDANAQAMLRAAEAERKKGEWERYNSKNADAENRRAKNIGAYEERARGVIAQAETLATVIDDTVANVAPVVSLH